MHLGPRYAAKWNYVAPAYRFSVSFSPFYVVSIISRVEKLYRREEKRNLLSEYVRTRQEAATTTVNCDRPNNGSGRRWMVYGFRFMYLVATEPLVSASPPPHSALCEPISPPSVRLCCAKRQKRFVRRACTSLSRTKFIIMSCIYVSPPDALAMTIRHFRKATDAFSPSVRPTKIRNPTASDSCRFVFVKLHLCFCVWAKLMFHCVKLSVSSFAAMSKSFQNATHCYTKI